MKRILLAVPVLVGTALMFVLFALPQVVSTAPIGTAETGKAF